MINQNGTAGLMGTKEAAAYVGKTRAAFRAGFKRWGIPYVKFGGQMQFTKEMLDGWIRANTVTPTAGKE